MASVRPFHSAKTQPKLRADTLPEGNYLTGKGCSRRGAGREAIRNGATPITRIVNCGHGPDRNRQDEGHAGGNRGDQKYRKWCRRLRLWGCRARGAHILGRDRSLLLGQKLGCGHVGLGCFGKIERHLVVQSPRKHSYSEHQNEEQCRCRTSSCRVNCEQSAGPWHCVFSKSKGPDGCNQWDSLCDDRFAPIANKSRLLASRKAEGLNHGSTISS